MLEGVVIDPLTEGFLGVAKDPAARPQVAEALRVFFHDARTHLNSVKLDIYLAKRFSAEPGGGIWPELDHCYSGLENLLDRVQTICKPAGRGHVTGDLATCLDGRRPTWEEWLRREGRSLDWLIPEGRTLGRFDPKDLIQGLDALIGWRAATGAPGMPARLASGLDGGVLWVEWSEPSASLEEPIEGREGRSVSMAFPLLARSMATLGGDFMVANKGGLVVRLTWPAGGDVNESDGRPA